MQALAGKASELGDALVIWLRSNGLRLVERRYNPHSEAGFKESPWSYGLIQANEVMVIVGDIDVNRVVDILRAARKPASPTSK